MYCFMKVYGGVVTPQHNVAQHVDLLVGVVPIVNLEWIQKLIRDTSERGHSREAVMDSVVRSMEDYINYITPQFSRTHLNFSAFPPSTPQIRSRQKVSRRWMKALW